MSNSKSSELSDIFSSQLLRAMEEKRLIPASLSRMMADAGFSLTATAIGNMINSGAIPNSAVLFGLSKVLGKPMDWFFGRSGGAIKPPDLIVDITPKLRAFTAASPLSMQHYIPIRLLKDGIAAGSPTQISENDIEGWVLIYASSDWMKHDPEFYTCAHVRGSSMSPILEHGDVIAIDHADRVASELNNKMVVFRESNREDTWVTVKWLRYIEESDLVIADPENRQEEGSRIYMKASDSYERIVGRVAWWWAKR